MHMTEVVWMAVKDHGHLIIHTSLRTGIIDPFQKTSASLFKRKVSEGWDLLEDVVSVQKIM